MAARAKRTTRTHAELLALLQLHCAAAPPVTRRKYGPASVNLKSALDSRKAELLAAPAALPGFFELSWMRSWLANRRSHAPPKRKAAEKRRVRVASPRTARAPRKKRHLSVGERKTARTDAVLLRQLKRHAPDAPPRSNKLYGTRSRIHLKARLDARKYDMIEDPKRFEAFGEKLKWYSEWLRPARVNTQRCRDRELLRSAGGRRRCCYDASGFSSDHDQWKDACFRQLLELAEGQGIDGTHDDAVYLDALDKGGKLRCTRALTERGWSTAHLWSPNRDDSCVRSTLAALGVATFAGDIVVAMEQPSFSAVVPRLVYLDLCTGTPGEALKALAATCSRTPRHLALAVAVTLGSRNRNGGSKQSSIEGICCAAHKEHGLQNPSVYTHVNSKTFGKVTTFFLVREKADGIFGSDPR